nr:MAG TPA: Bacterial transferase hexapeptide [Caudoviricetes sp.]
MVESNNKYPGCVIGKGQTIGHFAIKDYLFAVPDSPKVLCYTK